MMHKEFEQIAGYRVSYEDYASIIEPMYMALGDSISKQEFATMIDRKRFEIKTPSAQSLLRQIKKEATHLRETCERFTDYDSRNRLDAAAEEYARVKCGAGKDVFSYLNSAYAQPLIQRGCRYPNELVIGRGSTVYERIAIA